jgi:hypothetical protein
MLKLFASAGIGLTLVVSVTSAAAAKPGPARVEARAGAVVLDDSLLKPSPSVALPPNAPLGKAPQSVPPRLKGYSLVASAFASPSGQQASGSVACPAGTVAFGGGVVGASASVLQNVNGSIPAVSGGLATGWSAWVDNTSGTDSSLTVWGVCGKKPRQYTVVSLGFTNAAFSQGVGVVQCPLNARGKRMKVLGGGGIGSAATPGQDINTSVPVGPGANAWRLDENNSFGIDQSAVVFAVCGSAKSWRIVQGTAETNPAGQQTEADATCPAGLVALGGGLYSDVASTQINLNTTFPFSSDAWQSFENNASGSADTITPYVICAL